MTEGIAQGTQGSLVDRMVRAARLDTQVYEEVEADQSATGQAAIAVVIVAVLSGIGSAISVAMRASAGTPVGALVGGIIGALIGWVIWSYVTYFVGTRLFGGTATPGEMLRTIGFAQAPGALNVLGFIPVLGAIIRLVVFIWLLVASVIAVRQALDFDTGKAILTTVIGWLVVILITVVLGVLGFGAAMAFGR